MTLPSRAPPTTPCDLAKASPPQALASIPLTGQGQGRTMKSPSLGEPGLLGYQPGSEWVCGRQGVGMVGSSPRFPLWP